MRGACTGALCLLALACTPPEDPACLSEPGAPIGPVAAQVIDGEVRVRGFDAAAASAGGDVHLETASSSVDVTPDADGRFDAVIDGADAPGDTVEIDGVETAIRRGDPNTCVPGPERLTAGTVPNDVALVRCDEELYAVVAASGDGALHIISASSGNTETVPFAVDEANRGANPWHVATQGSLAATTLFGQHRVALVDACGARVLATAAPTDEAGDDVLVDVAPAVPLATPLDADGDGSPETLVSRMQLRHPQGVGLVGDVLLATFSNLLEVGPPARHGPGVLFRWRVRDGSLTALGATVLPFQNPQAVALDADGRPWVSASGVLEQRDGRFVAATDGALLRVDSETGAVLQVFDLARFAPGTPAFTSDHFVVGSLTQPLLRIGHLRDGMQAVELAVDGAGGPDRVESIFEVATLSGGLVVAAEFGTDQLHVVDPRGPTLHPWPFTEPLDLGTGDLPRGAQSIAIAPPRSDSVSVAEPDGIALLGLSSELVPLRFWQAVGP